MAGESPFRVRRATVADAEGIAAINVEAGRAGWAAFLDAGDLARFEPPVERYRDMIAEPSPARVVLVAIEEGRVSGFASTGTVDGAAGLGELTALYSHPAVWGRGAGRALLSAALEQLAASGCREAVLWTEERNERPRGIYERAGWRLDGGRRERLFLGQPIREVRYRIALAAPMHDDGDDRARSSAGRSR